ncbi:glucan ABC transporter ATP-binding protein/ permease [Methylovirgula sp. HY1]|uniref:glucan ABC transporter ATP-binding protein/ permease n=1 Tax=Methylovirgula sp. HY1 TaxID=2822761 RepID=UPI001C5B9C83|nr:glucan ABC transporter ATP-binding protein/ permease [Methylovirgula sp. HY1]QXX75087.1 Beta-(1-->2)glucan export ATP-binding/permease protein NdvA [Methylovirgula sp. HY1]
MSLPQLYVRALRLIGNEGRLAVFLVLGNLAIASAQFAEPVLFGRIVDRMNAGEAMHHSPGLGELLPLVSAWIGFALFAIVGSVFVGLHADRLAHRRRLVALGSYFEHVLNLPMSFHSATHSGRLLKGMIEGTAGLFWLWLSFFREKCAALVALTVLLPLSLFINWRLGSLLILLVAVFGVLITFVVRRTNSLQGEVERYNTNLTERASDVFGNIPVVQSFTRVESEMRSVAQLIHSVLTAQMPVLNWWAITVIGAKAAATLTLLAIFLLGVSLHAQGLASIGQIVTFTAFSTLLIAQLNEIVSFINGLFLQAPKLQEFFRVLDTPSHVVERAAAQDPGRLAGHVRFDHVSFSYEPGQTAIADVSFEIQPGETVALVGATGSGKSTTLNLLHRVFDPDEGAVKIDGIDIRDMTLLGLRRNIGVVFQEPMLFARSIEENLRVGQLDATAPEIALALERAQAADFVARQAHGLETMISERGRSLSGGERQRLSIARALLKDPPIMIFDEATSALDAETEAQLQKALASATQGRTTFIIAHRFSTIRNADHIIVFDHGHAVESGTFDELVAKGGKFAKLAVRQFMHVEPELARAAE